MEQMTESSLGHGSRSGSLNLDEFNLNSSITDLNQGLVNKIENSSKTLYTKQQKRNSMYDQFIEFNIDELEISD